MDPVPSQKKHLGLGDLLGANKPHLNWPGGAQNRNLISPDLHLGLPFLLACLQTYKGYNRTEGATSQQHLSSQTKIFGHGKIGWRLDCRETWQGSTVLLHPKLAIETIRHIAKARDPTQK